MIELLTILLLLIGALLVSVLSILNIPIESGMMGRVFLVVSVASYICFAINCCKKGKISKRNFGILVVYLLVLLLFLVTVFRYGGFNSLVRGQFLYYCSASVSAGLMGMVIAQKGRIASIGKWIPIFSVLLTYTVLSSLLFSKGLTNAGQLYDDSGMSYQNAAYYCALAFGLNLYYLIFNSEFETFKWADRIKLLLYVLIIPQVAIMFWAGGRGGFLLFIVYVIAFTGIAFYKFRLSLKTLLIAIGVITVSTVVVQLVTKVSINTLGLERVLNFINGKSSNADRTVLYSAAIKAFRKSPILGNGISSVFYEVGFYSHNIFTDILCEGGIVGILLFVSILVFYIRKQIKMMKCFGPTTFSFVIFLYGITMAMASSYYLSNHLLIFSVVYVLASKELSYESKIYKNF